MMQSLLLNGAASIKGNDLSKKDENDSRINSLRNSKLAEQQRSFAKVMQDNIDKENTRAQSRHTSSTQELNNDSRLENTNKREQNKTSDDKAVSEAKSSQKVNDKEQGKKLASADNKKADKNEVSDDAKKLVKNDKVDSSESDEIKTNVLANFTELELEGENESKQVNQEENNEFDIDPLNQFDAKVNAEEDSVDLDDSEIKLEEQSDNQAEFIDSDLVAMNTNTVDLESTIQENEEIDSEEKEVQNINSDSALDPMGQSSLLSQIEAAQKVDTNVKAKEPGDESSEITMSMLKSQSNLVNSDEKKALSLNDDLTAEAALKAKPNVDLEAKVDVDAEAEPKFKIEAESDIAKETNNVESDVDLDSSLQSLKPAEKLDQLSTMIKNEAAVANQTAIDVNGTRPNQTSQVQVDKLVAFNQQAPAANNLLQEPLDIQSKHAAAMMGERVMMMMSQGKQEVEIRLDPAELGSMLIKMQVKQDQVQLHIQTQAGLSKDIIEQNMPRLREQLAQQGIQLSEANVQQQSQQQSQQQQRQAQVSGSSRQLANSQEVVNDQKNVFIPSKIPSLEQGIDYYA